MALPSPETLTMAAFLERIPDAAHKRSIGALIKTLAMAGDKEEK